MSAPRWALPTVVSASLLFWLAASVLLDAPEPWDSPHYTAIFAVALLVVATLGWIWPDRAWRWAAIVILAQAPAMLLRAPLGPLFGVGILLLILETLPAMVVASVAALLRRHA